MRSQNSIKSAITAVVSNALVIIVGFVAQAVFVKTLGDDYLGINGLFNNIISMLSIVELGFGSAIIVNLYKPVAKGNEEKIKSLLLFYKQVYRIIAIIVTILGIILLPFLKYIVGEVSIVENIYFIFLLYLLDTIVSYLLTYKRSILYADQKSYIINIIHIAYVIVMNFFQIIYLLFFKEFIGYLVIKIICRILENVIITIIANKKYKYITEKNVKPINKRLKKSILIRVKGLVFHKIGTFVVLGSDNIIIAMMPNLGISQVGLYSNYNLIISALSNLFGQIFASLTASIGNLLVENNKQKTVDIYKSTLLINAWLYIFASISLYVISKPFIMIWLGAEYILNDNVVLILVINFYINGMRRTYATFKEAAGVYYQDRYVPIIESVVNIVFSIVLAYYFGLAGVFMGTIASNMVLYLFSFPKFVYKKILHGKIKDYIIENIQYAILFAFSFISTFMCTRLINIENSWVQLIIYSIICLIIPNLIMFIIFRKNESFLYFRDIIQNILNKFTGKVMRKKSKNDEISKINDEDNITIKYIDFSKVNDDIAETIVNKINQNNYKFNNSDFLRNSYYPKQLQNNYKFLKYVIDKDFNNLAYIDTDNIEAEKLEAVIDYTFKKVYYMKMKDNSINFDLDDVFKNSKIVKDKYFNECLYYIKKMEKVN